MTALDSIMAAGLRTMDALSGETFTFRNVPRVGNISDLDSRVDWVAGGRKPLHRMSIVYDRSRGDLVPVTISESITARGVTMKIEAVVEDETSLTFECVEVTK